jgi:hypothetical protein
VRLTGQQWYFALGWVFLVTLMGVWGLLEWRRRVRAKTSSNEQTEDPLNPLQDRLDQVTAAFETMRASKHQIEEMHTVALNERYQARKN